MNVSLPHDDVNSDDDDDYWDAVDAHYCCAHGKQALLQLAECTSCSLLLCPACEHTCPDCNKPCCAYCLVPGGDSNVSCDATVRQIVALDAALKQPFSFIATNEALTPCERAFFTTVRRYIIGTFNKYPGTWIFRPPRRLKEIDGFSVFCYASAYQHRGIEVRASLPDSCPIYCGFGPLDPTSKNTFSAENLHVRETSFGWWAFRNPDSPSAFHKVCVFTPAGPSR